MGAFAFGFDKLVVLLVSMGAPPAIGGKEEKLEQSVIEYERKKERRHRQRALLSFPRLVTCHSTHSQVMPHADMYGSSFWTAAWLLVFARTGGGRGRQGGGGGKRQVLLRSAAVATAQSLAAESGACQVQVSNILQSPSGQRPLWRTRLCGCTASCGNHRLGTS